MRLACDCDARWLTPSVSVGCDNKRHYTHIISLALYLLQFTWREREIVPSCGCLLKASRLLGNRLDNERFHQPVFISAGELETRGIQ